VSSEFLSTNTLVDLEKSISTRTSHPEWCTQGCFRLLHHESKQLRVDQFGDYLALYWFGATEPSEKECSFFDDLTNVAGRKGWFLFIRSGNPTVSLHDRQKPDFSWEAQESTLTYNIRSAHGNSPGLFLDQRQQREWVKVNSHGLRVLNLFSYTGGFSINALAGGAGEVVSVDTSKSAHDWARVNCEKNSLDPTQMHFYKDDVRKTLTKFAKKGRKFDIVVCDPPSFSRGKGEPFALKRDLDALVKSCLDILSEKGHLLFSTNLEAISSAFLASTIKTSLAERKTSYFTLRTFDPTFDFALKKKAELKSYLVSL
jgi:23S rRNA (cytosine1962-C5)-methyltransferase